MLEKVIIIGALGALCSLIQPVQLADCANGGGKNVICYFGSWSVERKGNGKFDVNSIPAHLCTHIFYAFVGLDEATGEVKVLNETAYNVLPDIGILTALRRTNPKLKIVLSMGGWEEGSAKYSQVAASPTKRQAMVQSVVAHLKKKDFDGFDLDWEYPANRDGASPDDKQNFILLLADLRAGLDAERQGRKRAGRPPYVLGVAVGINANLLTTAYDVKAMSQYLDIINLMTYDIKGAWGSWTTLGHNAALNDVKAAVDRWINAGAKPIEVHVGLASYGRSWNVPNPSRANVGTQVSGQKGAAGPYTEEAGNLGYNEICEKLINGQLSTRWDDSGSVPIAYDTSSNWVSYDNIQSIQKKVNWVRTYPKKLGGIMFWALDTDDFRGNCKTGRYPLITAAKNALHGK